MTNDYEAILRMLGGDQPKPEKGVKIHGRKIDGNYYVRASDMAELLEINGVLPNAASKLRGADR